MLSGFDFPRWKQYKDYLEILILSSLVSLSFGLVLFSYDYFFDHDLYFHIKIAELISQRGWLTSLPWMSHAIHADRYVDFHFIIHYLQAAFLLFTDDKILAAKLSGLTFIFFSLSCLIRFLQIEEVRHRWFWILFLFTCSSLFSFRFLFLRGSVFFLGIIVLHFIFIRRNRYLLIFLNCFISVWTYPGFPFLGIASIFYWIVSALEKNYENRILFATFLGLIAGFIIHPAFPHQFYGIWLELGIHSIRPQGLEPIGEWGPIPAGARSAALNIPFFFLLLITLFRGERTRLKTTLELLTLFLLFSVFGSIKPIEFFIPVLTIYIAMSITPIYSYSKKMEWALLMAFSVFLLSWNAKLNYEIIEDTRQIANPEGYFEGADWLKENTAKGTPVLIPWDKFHIFFFRNHHNVYSNGLNPVYSFGKDFIRYSKVSEFYQGVAQNLEMVPLDLDYEYVVIDKAFPSPTQFRLKESKWVKIAFENEKILIFRFPPRKANR